jgi:hypothetical protein
MDKNLELINISTEIKQIVDDYQKKNELSFIEDTHTYYIKDEKGDIRTDFPSVSTVLKCFYTPFDHTTTKSFQNCGGDKQKEDALLKEWADAGTYSTNMGSRVHYLLEKHLIDLYGSYKEVRRPIFNCDEEQIRRGDAMIKAGKDFIDLMHQRGAVLLDTEMVLGSIELGYTGQPDKVWLMEDKKGNPGIVVTDWKGLPLDTPILTDSGWKTMGSLTKEDMVYDKDGNLVNIINISQVKNKKCLKMIFDNGDEIVSDFEHRWLVCKEECYHNEEFVMTTEEIENHIKNSLTDLKIPINKSLKTNGVNIESNPFNMGLKINSNYFHDFIEIKKLINSSFDNRLDFVNGLIEGFSKIKGNNFQIKVKKKNLNLVVSIISSLGIKTSIKKSLFNYLVSIPLNGLDALNLEDKKAEERIAENYNDYYRKIVSVEEVESVPTKCIEVDSPSSTFLCGHNLLVTHNTNKEKNFQVQWYTKMMLHPFEEYHDTALGHYFVQLPLYAKLLLKMLEGTKYENIPLFGGVVVLTKDDGTFVEHRIPKDVIQKVLNMDMKDYL